jgi:hypothetical protein
LEPVTNEVRYGNLKQLFGGFSFQGLWFLLLISKILYFFTEGVLKKKQHGAQLPMIELLPRYTSLHTNPGFEKVHIYINDAAQLSSSDFDPHGNHIY